MSYQSDTKTFELKTRLSGDEIIKRIVERGDDMNAGNDKEAWLTPFRGYGGDRPFLYQINGDNIFIQQRPRQRNYQYGLRLQIVPMADGSKLIGRAALGSSQKAFMVYWFVFLALAGGIAIISIVEEVMAGKKPLSELLFILVPLAMATFGCLMIALGRRVSGKDASEISEWLDSLFGDSKF